MSLFKPLVSIGVPAYNDGRFLGQTLSSLLAQDYKDFELIISDNASSDDTEAICRSFANKDSRIRYYRNDENIGIVQNFNRVFSLSKGEFFMWAGAHDLWDSNVIRMYVDKLVRNPAVVLSFGEYHEINERGDFMKVLPLLQDTQGLAQGDRLKQALGNSCPFAIYGLIRVDALRKTWLFLPTLGTDFVLMAELALQGEFGFVPVKTYVRAFPQRTMTGEENMIRLIGAREAKGKKGKRVVRFPYLVSTLDMWHVFKKSDLPSKEKLKLAYRQLSLVKTGLMKELALGWMPTSVRLWLRRLANGDRSI